ncbi:hypothetical protein [Actinoallomurus sp. CA-150999]|uniref:hypothetical protein n=1 Tax=Actinoallomurus sp. CA-150999 TaxID=3239887 RepID=UPI003D90A2E8
MDTEADRQLVDEPAKDAAPDFGGRLGGRLAPIGQTRSAVCTDACSMSAKAMSLAPSEVIG